MTHLPDLVDQLCRRTASRAVIRVLDNSAAAAPPVTVPKRQFSEAVEVICEASPFNIGFGGGHNHNFETEPSDVFIVLNNDIAFEHLNSFDEAVSLLLKEKVAAIGNRTSPGILEKNFGFASQAASSIADKDYAEGSILLLSSEAYRKVGGFSSIYEYAYFEDADLSLKLKSHGYEIGFIDIPHEHHRASSTAKFGDGFYSSMYDHSRAAFFARWGEWLRSGTIGTAYFVDLNHDGIGDQFQAALSIRALAREIRQYGFSIDLKLRSKELAFLFSDLSNIEIVTKRPDREYLNVFDLADINLATPLPTAAMFAARLGVVDFAGELPHIAALCAQNSDALRRHKLTAGQYAVVHADSSREGFEGRAVAKGHFMLACSILLKQGGTVVLVGGRDYSPDFETFIESGAILDLRDKTSIDELVSLIRFASCFVGLDSGPANIALILSIPSFLIFGSVSPYAKMLETSGVTIFEADHVDCLGCYHRNIEPAYAVCYRRDQACVLDGEHQTLRASLEQFLAQPAGRPNRAYLHWMREQARFARLMMFHPLYQNHVLRPGAITGKKYGDAFIRLMSLAEEVIGARNDTYLQERRVLKDRVDLLEKELVGARRYISGIGQRQRAVVWAQGAGLHIDPTGGRLAIVNAATLHSAKNGDAKGRSASRASVSVYVAKGPEDVKQFTDAITLIVKTLIDCSRIAVVLTANASPPDLEVTIPELDIYGAALPAAKEREFCVVMREPLVAGRVLTLELKSAANGTADLGTWRLRSVRAYSEAAKGWL